MRMPIALPRPQRVERALELLGWCRDRDVPTALWETSPKALIATPSRRRASAPPPAPIRTARRTSLGSSRDEGRSCCLSPPSPSRRGWPEFGERAPDVAFLWPWDMTGEHLHHERMRGRPRYNGVVILNPTPGSPLPRSAADAALRPSRARLSGGACGVSAPPESRWSPSMPRAAGGLTAPQVVFDAGPRGRQRHARSSPIGSHPPLVSPGDLRQNLGAGRAPPPRPPMDRADWTDTPSRWIRGGRR